MDEENENYRGILIIDDEPTIRELTKYMLTEEGYKNITEATDGLDALEKLDNAQGREHGIEVILTDVNMPKYDARFMFRVLAEKGRLDDYGYVIMTALATDRELGDIKSILGKDRYNLMSKPFSMEKLFDSVEKGFLDYDGLHANEKR